ncbi:hypothetical protein LZ32DRAFT_333896 [Colletotrichum eremochloae]|nr:hypothetical protein LZ32DRAFT_333896 [Colletotrichum eremochloae]
MCVFSSGPRLFPLIPFPDFDPIRDTLGLSVLIPRYLGRLDREGGGCLSGGRLVVPQQRQAARCALAQDRQMEAAGCKIVGGADGVLVNNLTEQLATLRPGPGGSVPTDRQLLDVKSRLCDYRFHLPVKARRHGAWAGLGWWGLDGNATWHLSYLGSK